MGGFAERLASELRRRMPEHHITASDLAKRLGVSQSTVSRLMNADSRPALAPQCILANKAKLAK